VSLYSPDGSLLVRDLSFEVLAGQSVIIMGPNGRYDLSFSVPSIVSIFLFSVAKASANISWFRGHVGSTVSKLEDNAGL